MPDQSGIFYTDNGSGIPVVFLHGFCETHQIWQSFSSSLSENYRVICLDLPGFGQSKLLPTGFSIADVASNVISFLKGLKVESCVLVGHSLGGYVTLEMAHQQPEFVNGFCLFHSTAYPDSEEKKISRNKVIEFVTKNGVRPFTESFIPPLFYVQTNEQIATVVKMASNTPLETLIAYVKSMRDRPDRTNVLREFAKPILFIAGEKDAGISVESVQKQADLAQKATLLTLPNVAHMGMFENKQRTLGKVNEFLQDRLADFL